EKHGGLPFLAESTAPRGGPTTEFVVWNSFEARRRATTRPGNGPPGAAAARALPRRPGAPPAGVLAAGRPPAVGGGGDAPRGGLQDRGVDLAVKAVHLKRVLPHVVALELARLGLGVQDVRGPQRGGHARPEVLDQEVRPPLVEPGGARP